MSSRVTQWRELEAVELCCKDSKATVALYGATLVSWEVDGEECLWVSGLSATDGSKPIRGGVPIAWPQFADQGPLPLHGFAREQRWRHAGTTLDNDEAVVATFALTDADCSAASWTGGRRFALTYTVSLGAALEVRLTIENTDDAAPLAFTSCLHTYFATPDVDGVRFEGLQGRAYYDKVATREWTDDCDRVADAAAVTGQALADPAVGFVDRIFKGVAGPYDLRVSPARAFRIEHSGFPDTVLFNPWLEGKRGDKGPDFDDDGYRHMLCIEPAITLEGGGPLTLQPGRSWAGSQRITPVF